MVKIFFEDAQTSLRISIGNCVFFELTQDNQGIAEPDPLPTSYPSKFSLKPDPSGSCRMLDHIY